VAVDRAGWPDARVLALRAPGTEQVLLDVHASAGQPGASQQGGAGGGRAGGENAAGDGPHWEV
jgi:hypothetical protein